MSRSGVSRNCGASGNGRAGIEPPSTPRNLRSNRPRVLKCGSRKASSSVRNTVTQQSALAKIGFSDVDVKCEIDAINREMGEGVVNGLRSANLDQHRRDVNQHINSRNSSGDNGSRVGATQERFSDRLLTR